MSHLSLLSWNVFHDPQFWQHFEKEVKEKTWSCEFNNDILQSSLENDAALYDDPTTFKKRRSGVQQWTMNTALWVATVLGACKELSNGENGEYVRQLDELKILEAFSDYLDHLNFFQMVADKMASLGQRVKPLSQDSSGIHDIDKLDPIMLVGYSEKFEDMMNTSIWNLCVDRHTKVNPHHQAHCMWNGCCEDTNGCTFCEDNKIKALREMICDKVSRRVQKNLGGKLSKDMWDVDIAFFSGLPEDWLEKAKSMMMELKGNDTYT
ncbi:uncharacterized protein [Parasteatoda tepidariorum]|nr:uncharacterized protein LOC107449832 isoform X2 [Parasteatoda tepidariorum]XP_042902302.1 uncharacterized protein LOC107449832 isoform X2 [Parasteatoda tepidariorum]